MKFLRHSVQGNAAGTKPSPASFSPHPQSFACCYVLIGQVFAEKEYAGRKQLIEEKP